ncbi:hypothetical protein EMIT0158MI4_150041 [Burkholderia ambifaria]
MGVVYARDGACIGRFGTTLDSRRRNGLAKFRPDAASSSKTEWSFTVLKQTIERQQVVARIRPLLADYSPTVSRCRMPASNGLHPVESATLPGHSLRQLDLKGDPVRVPSNGRYLTRTLA